MHNIRWFHLQADQTFGRSLWVARGGNSQAGSDSLSKAWLPNLALDRVIVPKRSIIEIVKSMAIVRRLAPLSPKAA